MGMNQENFYVYGLFDPSSGIPFYIGKGSGRRATQHVGVARRGSHLPVHKKIRSMDVDPEIKILSNGLSEPDAYELEELAISTIGRRRDKSGPLLNLSTGGEGGMSGHTVILTQEQAEKRNAALRSPEVRAKISAALKGKKKNISPEGRASIVATHKGKVLSEETRNKISESKKGMPGHPHSVESKAKISESNRRRTVSDETKRKISESVKARPLTPEQQDKQRKSVLAKVKCPNCGKVGARSIMMRWHFDNCRMV